MGVGYVTAILFFDVCAADSVNYCHCNCFIGFFFRYSPVEFISDDESSNAESSNAETPKQETSKVGTSSSAAQATSSAATAQPQVSILPTTRSSLFQNVRLFKNGKLISITK